MRKAVWLVMAGTVALGACHKKTESAANHASPAAPGTAPGTATSAPSGGQPASPASTPLRRAGLWEQTVASAGATQSSRICLDASLSKQLAAWGQAQTDAKCQEGPMTPRPGGGWAFSSTCDMGAQGKTTTEGVLSGDPASRYAIDAQTTTTGAKAQMMNGVHKFSMKAEWIGPCPADMKPGDMTLPGGQKINLAALAAGKAGKRP